MGGLPDEPMSRMPRSLTLRPAWFLAADDTVTRIARCPVSKTWRAGTRPYTDPAGKGAAGANSGMSGLFGRVRSDSGLWA